MRVCETRELVNDDRRADRLRIVEDDELDASVLVIDAHRTDLKKIFIFICRSSSPSTRPRRDKDHRRSC